MGSMEEFIHTEKLTIFKRRLADPTITDEQRQMLTRLLALEQARDVPETEDALGGLAGILKVAPENWDTAGPGVSPQLGSSKRPR